ncbi:hypothetical protein CEE44_04785 [Candidatus Woesearchaeota archaeon B3_Woes]|nr:MAG: hypothetical protein CEE44_04785 [Candidatus Woesearchaeota archaeon B3_Woes]
MVDWFNQAWRQFQEDHLITPESFDLDPNVFQERISRDQTTFDTSRISYPLQGKTINDVIDMLERGSKPSEFPYYYDRAGSAAKDALAHRLVMAEAGYLEEYDINPLEHVGATTFPCGMSAIANVAEALVMPYSKEARTGLRFLRGKDVYFHTGPLLKEVIPQKMGIEPALEIDTTNPDEVRAALEDNKDKIIAIFYEPITNPLLEYTDTRKIHEVAREYGVPIITDNTFLTPFLSQPLREGADIVIHSMTKYMSGEGDTMGGAVIGPAEFIKSLTQKIEGDILPNSQLAKLFYNRIPSLPDNMKRHVDNAIIIYDFLSQHPNVESATYTPDTLLNTRYGAPGAVLNFTLKGNSDEERLANVAAFEHYIQDNPGAIVNKVSLGERQHLLIGEKDQGSGFVRFAVGREPEAGEVIKYLNKALDHVYQKSA